MNLRLGWIWGAVAGGSLMIAPGCGSIGVELGGDLGEGSGADDKSSYPDEKGSGGAQEEGMDPSLGGSASVGGAGGASLCGDRVCDVDCEVSDWGEWSLCTAECGGGKEKRRRVVTTRPQGDGEECPELFDAKECNTHDCPVDCQLSDWGDWSACSKECGGGEKFKKRQIVVEPVADGRKCGVLKEVATCNLQLCPVDCQVSGWSDWSACSVNCSQTRTRTVIEGSDTGGQPCPELSENQVCSGGVCPR